MFENLFSPQQNSRNFRKEEKIDVPPQRDGEFIAIFYSFKNTYSNHENSLLARRSEEGIEKLFKAIEPNDWIIAGLAVSGVRRSSSAALSM